MSIQEILGKFKRIYEDTDLYVATIVTLVAVISFGLGRLTIRGNNSQTMPVEVAEPDSHAATAGNVLGTYVASKNGTKYHLPWCAGAQQIKDENKIWFATKAEAESKGYSPAGNCKGI